MRQSSRRDVGLVAALATALTMTMSVASAQEPLRRHKGAHARTAAQAQGYDGDRPLTIGGHRAGTGAGAGQGRIIQVSPNEVYAVGGFPYRGPRPNFAEREELRKEARNARIRGVTSGIYGYGGDGLGGTDFDVGRDEGYNNPNYGGAYNRYVGYNGVPTTLAFGPSFAFRHITEPDEDDSDPDASPFPQDYGYTRVTPTPDE